MNTDPLTHLESAVPAQAIADGGASGPSFLIFNFFAGVLHRGIPMYVQNLRVGLEQHGVRCREVRCPTLLRRLPRRWLNLLFVGYEQLVMPVLALAFDRAIHPYNSVSLLGSLTGKSALVVHDFIPNSSRSTKFSARYIRATQFVHARLGRDVIFISRRTETFAGRAGLFPRSRTFLFPNSFFRFMRHLRPEITPRSDHVLLCTGWGANKDLTGALELYRASGLCLRRKLKILGISGHAEAVDAFCARHEGMAHRIAVLPRLQDDEVAEAYRAAAWVWVHSRTEGYGRSIAEAKICACRIVASDIAPFREQKDSSVFLYSGLSRFLDAWSRCEAAVPQAVPHEPVEHQVLHREIARFLHTSGLGRKDWSPAGGCEEP
jgi:hypothetical protein